MPKKLKGGPLWSRPVLYVTLETFLVQFPGPTGASELLVELFWSFQVYRKKHRRKAMTTVDAFLQKSATKK